MDEVHPTYGKNSTSLSLVIAITSLHHTPNIIDVKPLIVDIFGILSAQTSLIGVTGIIEFWHI